MSASPAVQSRGKSAKTRVAVAHRQLRKVANKKTDNKKVIRLPLSTRSAKQRGLSDLQKENLVLEYRLKARRLARSILRKWHARMDLDEVDSVVDLSLCEAVKRFNPAKGASFMTFMYYHLRGNLIRSVTAAATANSVPLPDFEALDNGQKLESSLGAGQRGINAIEVAEALCSHDTVLPDEALFKKEVATLSHEACNALDPLEREVIFRIYMDEHQLMDIARSLGYSRCHISRVKKKALDTLYQEMRNKTGSDLGARILADDEDDLPVRLINRRHVQRRRPRSGTISRQAARSRDQDFETAQAA